MGIGSHVIILLFFTIYCHLTFDLKMSQANWNKEIVVMYKSNGWLGGGGNYNAKEPSKNSGSTCDTIPMKTQFNDYLLDNIWSVNHMEIDPIFSLGTIVNFFTHSNGWSPLWLLWKKFPKKTHCFSPCLVPNTHGILHTQVSPKIFK